MELLVVVGILAASACAAVIWWAMRHRKRYGLRIGVFAAAVAVLVVASALTNRSGTRFSPWAEQLVVTAPQHHWSAHLIITNDAPTSAPLNSIVVAWKMPPDMAQPNTQAYRVGSTSALWQKTWSEPISKLSKQVIDRNLEHSMLIVTLKGHGRSQTIHLMLHSKEIRR